MKREDKYPDTSVFHFHNQNPKNRFTTDCVVRAISTVCEIPYNEVVMGLAKIQCETGYDTSENRLYGKYLESLGYKKNPQPKKTDGTKYTGREFCKKFHPARTIAHIGGNHIVAIIDGKVWDTWDSTDGCIGNYYTKE